MSGTDDSVKEALYISVNGSAMVLIDAITSFTFRLSSPDDVCSENILFLSYLQSQ